MGSRAEFARADVNVSLLVDEVLGGLNAVLVSAGIPDAAKETLALNPLTPCTTISVETVQAARALAGRVVSEKSGGAAMRHALASRQVSVSGYLERRLFIPAVVGRISFPATVSANADAATLCAAPCFWTNSPSSPKVFPTDAEQQQTLIILLRPMRLYLLHDQVPNLRKRLNGMLTKQSLQSCQTKLLLFLVDYFRNAICEQQEQVTGENN